MSIDADFLSKLVCPKSRRPLRLATTDELEQLNLRIASGDVQSSGGESITDAVEQGLVPEGETIVYPIRDGVPVLLAEESIPL